MEQKGNFMKIIMNVEINEGYEKWKKLLQK